MIQIFPLSETRQSLALSYASCASSKSMAVWARSVSDFNKVSKAFWALIKSDLALTIFADVLEGCKASSTSPSLTKSPAAAFTSCTTPLVFHSRLAKGWAANEPEASTVSATSSEVTTASVLVCALLVFGEKKAHPNTANTAIAAMPQFLAFLFFIKFRTVFIKVLLVIFLFFWSPSAC